MAVSQQLAERMREVSLRAVEEWRGRVEALRVTVPFSGKTVHDIHMDPWAFALAMGVVYAEEGVAGIPVELAWQDVVEARARRLRTWTKKVGQWVEKRVLGDLDTNWMSATPPWLTREEAEAWRAARDRAGALITKIDDEGRARVRELVVAAIGGQWGAERLATELKQAFGTVQRDWARVARTELARAYGEGVLAAGEASYGAEARVARVPERDACERCMDTYTENGRPIIWRVPALRAAGVEGPLHPNCRCGTVVAPPGHVFDAGWNLVRP